MKIVQLIFFLILGVHWINCLWFGITDPEGASTSWFPPKDIDYRSTIIRDENRGLDIYILYFYYGVLTLVANELIPTS